MVVIGFGDSITAGAYLQEEETYLYKLGQELGLRIVNAGVPGNTSSQGIARMQEEVISKKPDICIIAFGMNDHVAKARNEAKVPLELFVANLSQIGNEVERVGGVPILCTIQPIIEGDEQGYYYSRHPRDWYTVPDGAQARIQQYNEAIRNLAAQKQIILADVAQRWQRARDEGANLHDLLRTVENSGIADGVHPTEQGMELYAECVAEAIKNHKLLS